METTKQISTVTAPDIHCDGCANSIKRALGRMPGVEQVTVDIDSKKVTVTHDPDVARDTLLDKLDKAGFPAS